jgi:hypothetical protein
MTPDNEDAITSQDLKTALDLAELRHEEAMMDAFRTYANRVRRSLFRGQALAANAGTIGLVAGWLFAVSGLAWAVLPIAAVLFGFSIYLNEKANRV